VRSACCLELCYECCHEWSYLEQLVMSRLPSFYLGLIIDQMEKLEEKEAVTRHRLGEIVGAKWSTSAPVLLQGGIVHHTHCQDECQNYVPFWSRWKSRN
jgi:hypothetical protein